MQFSKFYVYMSKNQFYRHFIEHDLLSFGVILQILIEIKCYNLSIKTIDFGGKLQNYVFLIRFSMITNGRFFIV